MVNRVLFFPLVLAILLGVCIAPVEAQKKSTTTKPTPRKELKATVPSAKLTPSSPATAEKKSRFLQYVPDDAMIIVAAQPSRVINAKGLQGLVEAAEGKEVLKGLLQEFEKNTGLRIQQIEEVGLVMDAASLEDMSKAAQEQADRVRKLNGLKQIALAMHNFHDTNSTFPASDGYGDNKGNLSWRVHLLPYLDQAALYNEFNLDEPWDSEHNKPLIERMPELFKTPDVEDAGKTSYHLFAGEGTPFGGEEAPGMRDFTDGTSNTILAVIAGADKADIWTKPGGLEIDVEDPVAALGTVDAQIATAFTDGSARFLPADLEPSELLHFIQHQDGNVVGDYSQSTPSSHPMPGVIVCANSDIDQNTLLSKLPPRNAGKTVTIEGRDAHALPDKMFLIFVDSKTMLMGTENTLKAMLSPRTKSGDSKTEFEALYPANDIVGVVDLEPVAELVQELSQRMPMAPLVQNIVGVAATIDATGTGESHLNLIVEMTDAANAQQVNAIAMGGFQMMKVQALGQLSSDNSPVSEELVTVLANLLDSVTIETVEESVELDVPKVSDPEQFLKDVTPAMKELVKGLAAAQEAAARRAQTMPLRNIGLAFHNYHDVYGAFPSYCAPRKDADVNKGLSWRVHLLPFLDESPLYQEFHLDERWDSDHNKKLIERMPKVFESAGVEKRGHTNFHVFVGERTPFGNEEPVGIASIIDGTSNTIMVVQTGDDKAEIWTKPSGIEFNPEDPKAALGKIAETFLILLCDGSVRSVSKDLDEATLSRLIQHADQEILGDF